MTTLRQMIQDSTLTRLCAILFLFSIVIGSAIIVGWQFLTGQQPNTWLVGILGIAIGSSIKILGISAGISFVSSGQDKTV